MKYASIGSISHGTLRTEDLLATFASELDTLVKRNYDAFDKPVIFKFAAMIGAAETMTDDHDSADELVIELQDALNEFAPPYCYFGNTEGDGSDFGFWPSMDQIDELPKISDPNEVENHLGEPCCFGNDHGNITVYGADGRVLLDIV